MTDTTITIPLEDLLAHLRTLTAYVGAKAPAQEASTLPNATQHRRLALTSYDYSPWRGSLVEQAFEQALTDLAALADHAHAPGFSIGDDPEVGTARLALRLPDNFNFANLPALRASVKLYLCACAASEWFSACSMADLSQRHQTLAQAQARIFQTLMFSRLPPPRLDRSASAIPADALTFIDGQPLMLTDNSYLLTLN